MREVRVTAISIRPIENKQSSLIGSQLEDILREDAPFSCRVHYDVADTAQLFRIIFYVNPADPRTFSASIASY